MVTVYPDTIAFTFRSGEPPVKFDLAKVKAITGDVDTCWPVQIQLAQLMNSSRTPRTPDDARRYACAWCPTPGAPGHTSTTSAAHCPVASLVSAAGAAQLRSCRDDT